MGYVLQGGVWVVGVVGVKLWVVKSFLSFHHNQRKSFFHVVTGHADGHDISRDRGPVNSRSIVGPDILTDVDAFDASSTLGIWHFHPLSPICTPFTHFVLISTTSTPV